MERYPKQQQRERPPQSAMECNDILNTWYTQKIEDHAFLVAVEELSVAGNKVNTDAPFSEWVDHALNVRRRDVDTDEYQSYIHRIAEALRAGVTELSAITGPPLREAFGNAVENGYDKLVAQAQSQPVEADGDQYDLKRQELLARAEIWDRVLNLEDNEQERLGYTALRKERWPDLMRQRLSQETDISQEYIEEELHSLLHYVSNN